jgi:RNA polymerase-binding transcription factor DksA
VEPEDKKAFMARAGASKSLDKPAPKARRASEAVKPAPVKVAAKTVRKKAEPAVVAPKPPAKAAKTATPAATKAKAAKAAKPAARAGEAVKAPPAKAVNVKAKPAPATKPLSTRQSTRGRPPNPRDTEVAVAEAPKAKRAGTATKAPAKAAPAAAPDKASSEAAGFPAKTLDKLRRLLDEERETYVRQARDLAAEAEALAAEREPGDTQFDEESGEGDTLNVERERDLALSASATQAVEDIDAAIHRMDTGRYGVCERCGKKIAMARLEALPFAALCIECKSREERRR